MTPRQQICPTAALVLALLGGVQALHAVPTDVGDSLTSRVPTPDLSSLQPTARNKVEQTQSQLETLVTTPGARAVETADGFGFLGQLYQAYDLREAAEACYLSASRLAPEDPRWPHLLGLVRNEQGDLDGAVQGYRDALALEPGNLFALVRLGNALLELGRDDEARQCFDDALELAPKDAAALFGAGRVAQKEGSHQEAVVFFEKALEAQPDANVIHYPLGISYRSLGKLEKSRQHLARQGNRAVRIEDPLADMLTFIEKQTAFQVLEDLAKAEDFSEKDYLGFILTQFGTMVGAADRLRDTVKQVEESESGPGPVPLGRLHYATGALLVAEGRDEEALTEFRRAVELAPELQDARVKLGNGLARAGRLEEALAQYDSLLKKSPDDSEILIKRATLLMGMDRLEEARSDVERVLAMNQENRLAHLKLAECLERLGDLQGSMDQFKEAIELSVTPEEEADAHLRVAQMFRRMGERRAAVIAYDRSLSAASGYVESILGLASLLGEMGNYRESAEMFARALAVEPQNADAWVGEVTGWILAGDHQKGRERLEAGLIELPDNLDLTDILARHLAGCPDPSVRDGGRALELAQKLYDSLPTAESMETLAMAFAQAGRYDEAVAWQRKLLREYGENALDGIEERWRANLTRYERGETCCAAGR